jgi:4-hydroxymandelate oxidase
VFSAVPPRPGDAAPTDFDTGVPADDGWGIRRAVRLAFPGPSLLTSDAAYAARLNTYINDMLCEYGLEPSRTEPGPGGQTYSEMAEALIERPWRSGSPIRALPPRSPRCA